MTGRAVYIRFVEDLLVAEVQERGQVVSLFQFAIEMGIEYRHLRLCAARAVQSGRLTVETLANLPGRPNCYRPAQEVQHA